MLALDTRMLTQTGEQVFGPLQLPVDVTSITVTLDRNTWPVRGKVLCSWVLELSDDGKLWVPQVEGSAGGGTTKYPYSAQTANFKQAVPAGMWVQARVVTTESVDTKVGLTWQ